MQAALNLVPIKTVWKIYGPIELAVRRPCRAAVPGEVVRLLPFAFDDERPGKPSGLSSDLDDADNPQVAYISLWRAENLIYIM